MVIKGSKVYKTLVVLLIFTLLLFTSQASIASSSSEQDFVQLLNATRAENNLPPLPISDELSDAARVHSRRMASNGAIYHNPDLGTEVSGWAKLGENVGVGSNASGVHTGFERSTDHFRNIVDNFFTEVGVGVVESDGLLWVTQVYRTPVVDSGYKDDSDISQAHRQAVYELRALEILVGDSDGNFNPKDSITREQFASVISRLLSAVQ